MSKPAFAVVYVALNVRHVRVRRRHPARLPEDLVSNHSTEAFVDDELTTAGHTALVSHNHSTNAQALACDDCATPLGSFPPDRWRAKRIREAWQKHLDQARAA